MKHEGFTLSEIKEFQKRERAKHRAGRSSPTALLAARVEQLEAALADAMRHIGDPREDVCERAMERARAALAEK